MILRRILFALIGAALLYLVLQPWGAIAGVTLFVLGVLLMVAATMGERLSGSSFTRTYSGAATVLLNTIVALLLIETLAAVVVNLREIRTPSLNDIRGTLPYYRNTDWGADHWQEIETITERYEPFTVWRSQAFEGVSAIVLEDGTRLTPGANCDDPDAYTVFMFGGSTMWGLGASDEGTIPAYVQAALGEDACVVNYGMFGYVATQNTIKLMTELQQGRVPDAVIFYDGVNDVLATHQNGAAAAHQNLSEVAAAYEPNTLASAMLEALRESYTMQLMGGVLPRPAPQAPDRPDNITLATQTADAYLLNVAIVDRLATEYGFEYALFWQPVITVGDKPLTPEEAPLAGGLGDAGALYTETYQLIEQRADDTDNLHYIADAFDDTEQFLYVDPFHIVPEGNEIIANRMLQAMNLSQGE
ncbi:MAG: SGNH/GDSL hydrolase family protein [Chloroflexota bacterium]